MTMMQSTRRPTRVRSALGMAELIYHGIVRDVRRSHRSAIMSLAMNVVQTIVFLGAFYVMFAFIGVRGSAIHRADFLIYLLSGIFPYLTHTRAMMAVISSEGPTSEMMKHAPLNTMVSIASSSLSALYLQVFALFIVLFLYHVVVAPVVIDDPVPAMGMVILAWFSGVAVGTIFLALKPWFPDFVQIAGQIYARANMIASGKMFVANTLTASMVALFDWNPLFHIIDQLRGHVFANYNPHNSNLTYPIVLSLVLLLVGLLGENFTRQHASASWNAKR